MTHRNVFLIVFTAVLLLNIGCTRHKNLVYMQDRYELNDTVSKSIAVKQAGELKLLPGDNLYVNIYGIDFGQLGIFNKQVSPNTNYNETSLYMQGYQIDDGGFINIPIVGKISVVGLTLLQAREILQKAIDEYIKGAVVEVRLLSFEVTLLGEVKRPGTYTFLKRDISILDALGKAGDVSDFGDKTSLMVIRKFKDRTETIELDMTNSDFFQDPYFWLEPNDVVYVKPLKSKMINVNGTTISIILSSLTTLFLFVGLFNY